jgi:multicomponent K+:H+ antiporter subunit E
MTLLRRIGWRTALGSIALWALWLALASPAGPGQVLLGLVVAVAVPALVGRLQAVQGRARKPRVVVRYVATILLDVVVSNAQVGWDVVRGRWRRARWDFVTVPLDLRDPAGLATLAVVTTIVPGTVWTELAPDGSTLLLHVWCVDDPVDFIARYKARYEQPLKEIFE